MEDAPRLKVIMVAVISSTGSWKANFSRKYHREISSRPKPTTVKPMTEPAEKATRRPLFRLSWQALAVRELARVATVSYTHLIVERVANNVVITVEGNTGSTGATANGDGVYRRNWPLTSTWIKGYGHPAYGEEEDDVEIKEISIRDLDRDRLIQVSAVNIEGTNYIRLRDTEKLFPVTVSFDQAAATPTIALNYTK